MRLPRGMVLSLGVSSAEAAMTRCKKKAKIAQRHWSDSNRRGTTLQVAALPLSHSAKIIYTSGRWGTRTRQPLKKRQFISGEPAYQFAYLPVSNSNFVAENRGATQPCWQGVKNGSVRSPVTRKPHGASHYDW